VQAVVFVPYNAHLCFRMECILHSLADVRIDGKDDGERNTIVHCSRNALRLSQEIGDGDITCACT